MSRFRRLLSFVLPYKWKVAQNVLYNLLQAFFALFSFAMIIPFLQVLFGLQEVVPEPMEFEPSAAYLRHTLNYQMGQMAERHGDIGSLVLVSILVVIFSLLKNGFIYAASYVLAPIRAYVVRDIRNSIYGKVIRLPLSFFTEARKGDVMTRISSDVQELESSLLSSLQMMFRDPITIVVFLVMMFGISFQLTLFVLIMLPLSGFIIGRIGRSLRKSSYRGQKRLGELMSILEETLGGLRIIKAFNGEGQMMESFRHTNHQFARLIRKVFRRKPLASPLSEFLGTIVLMIILLYGGRLVLEGSNDLQGENLIFFLIIFTQILTPAKHLSNAWVSIQKGMASMERIEELLHAEVKILERSDAREAQSFKESIEFRNVSFRYDKDLVLKNINFTVKKGQTIALVGKSGSGKSTMVDLLPRFMDPLEGDVLIDGVPVRDYTLSSLRSLMGMVSQQSILFNDSFRNNIAFGHVKEATQAQVEEAARVANAHDFIMEHPGGYADGVGEGGGKLSGGQKQRISIARAVLANPPILILDEATSALDTESERLVQDAIIKLMQNRTSIVIAHRLSTIKHADMILVLDEGQVVERGTHQELIRNKNGVYKKLHSMQMY